MDYLAVLTEMLIARGLADNTVRNYQTYIRPYLAYLQGLGLPLMPHPGRSCGTTSGT